MIKVVKTNSLPTNFEENSPPVILRLLIVQSSELKQVCAWEKLDYPVSKCGGDGLCSGLSAPVGNLMNGIQPLYWELSLLELGNPCTYSDLDREGPCAALQSKAIEFNKNCLAFTLFQTPQKTWNAKMASTPIWFWLTITSFPYYHPMFTCNV